VAPGARAWLVSSSRATAEIYRRDPTAGAKDVRTSRIGQWATVTGKKDSVRLRQRARTSVANRSEVESCSRLDFLP
jgi:hypothetical protein